MQYLKKLLAVPPIALAALGFMWLQAERPMTAQEAMESAIPVRVLEIGQEPFAVTVSGFGRAQAARTWSGVAEVQGRLTQYSDAIQVGALVSAGETVFAIDPRDFEIAVAQAEASVQSAKADLAELDVSEANQIAILAAERNIFALLEEDRNRTASLVQSGTFSQSTLDDNNRTLLSQQSVVTNAEANLALITPQRQTAEAALARAEADLEGARRDLSRAEVSAPFAGRVTARNASLDQYVRVGDVLLTIEDTAFSEIEAAIQPADLATLLTTLTGLPPRIRPEFGLTSSQVEDILGQHVSAQVRIRMGNGRVVTWPARLRRITGTINAESGALGVVVAVDEAAFPNAETGRPPLTNGAFAEVILTGPELTDAILVPRDILHRDETGQSYVLAAGPDDRLVRIDVEPGPVAGGRVLIRDGLAPGTRVVLSNVIPAAPGVLLSPVAEVVP